jgi:methionyl-tRNA synthetase
VEGKERADLLIREGAAKGADLQEGLMSQHFTITTPIYYVNDVPHIGHSYTTVAADVISRLHRMRGHEVFFLTGTDEHGQKVLEAANRRGVTPQQHTDELHLRFKNLWARLDVQYDAFVRTTDAQHQAVVRRVLQELHDRGEIYQATYAGWYSTAAERFWTEKDLIDGKCPDSGLPVEWVEEMNYFFKMGDYADQLRAWLEAHPDWVRPESRRNELIGALKKDVGDLCISRPKARMSWGIPLPFDEDYVTYVWFDALLNYVSAAGIHDDPAAFAKRWPADFQLLGKDILTTHTVYWGTMLFAMGLEPARCLYAHGWWTVEGQKMSKSLGNVVDPNLLVDAYGPDALRYVLMSEKGFGADGDFSHKAFLLRYNAELANDIGNLAHRAISMTEKWLGGVVPALDADRDEDRALFGGLGHGGQPVHGVCGRAGLPRRHRGPGDLVLRGQQVRRQHGALGLEQGRGRGAPRRGVAPHAGALPGGGHAHHAVLPEQRRGAAAPPERWGAAAHRGSRPARSPA